MEVYNQYYRCRVRVVKGVGLSCLCTCMVTPIGRADSTLTQSVIC